MESPSHIEYHRFRRNESCTEEGCKARKFYIEDGKKFCQSGHEQAGFTQTQQDEDDWNAQGKRSRKKREETEQAARIVSGREAAELYLQCYQLILWRQCHWLLTARGLPKELETVIRDLWSLRVKALQAVGDEKSGYSSGGGFSSTSEGDNTESDATDSKSWASRKTRLGVTGKNKLPKLTETLALCYLGALLLRLPISLGELYRWAANDDITYTRAIKEVPKEMRARLPAHFHSALEIRAPLKAHSLQVSVSKMFEFYNIHYEMVFPSLNVPLLLFKHMTDLALPVEIYGAVQNLRTLLGLDFTYSTGQRASRNRHAFPEIQLMCLVVIAVKLSHPFDDIARVSEQDSDPTAVKINWDIWRDVVAKSLSAQFRVAKHMETQDTDVLTMSPGKLDEYLDWYQRTWVDDRDPKMAAQLLELFPLPQVAPGTSELGDSQERVERVKEIQRGLVLQRSEPSENFEPEDIRRPGELYRRYRTVDELPEKARIFYEMAAACAGTSIYILVKSVLHIEMQLGEWRLPDRKGRLSEDADRRTDHTASDD